MNGTDTLTFPNNMVYTGATTVNSGTLRLGVGGKTGSVAGSITNNGTVLFDRGYATTYAGVISGTGTVIKKGRDTLTLTGTNTLTGTTRILDGVLRLGAAGTTGSLVGNIENNTVLLFQRNNAMSAYSGVISGPGRVEVNNASITTILSGSNTYTGKTEVVNGVLNVQHANALGSSSAPTLIYPTARLQLQNNVTVAAESLWLSSSYNPGAIYNVSGTNAWNGPIYIADSATVANVSGSLTIGGTLYGNSPFVMNSGVVRLSGSGPYQGMFRVTSGEARIDGNYPNAAGVVVASAKTLSGSGDVAGTTTLSNYSTLSPGAGSGATGTLTVDHLVLADTSILAFDLGSTANHDQVVVHGNLWLNGRLQINALGGFGEGTYPLIDCDGAVLNSGLVLESSLPGYTLTIQVAGGVVNLVVVGSSTGSMTWDTDVTAGYQAAAGTWGSDNFWTSNGTDLVAWPGAGNSAVFAGTSGTYGIAVSGTQTASGLDFQTTGYTLSGDTLLLQDHTGIVARSGVTAILSSPVKMVSGNARLYASNTGYTSSGTLRLLGGLNAGLGNIQLYGQNTSAIKAYYEWLSGEYSARNLFLGGYTGSLVSGGQNMQLILGGTSQTSITDTIILNQANQKLLLQDNAILDAGYVINSGNAPELRIGGLSTLLANRIAFTHASNGSFYLDGGLLKAKGDEASFISTAGGTVKLTSNGGRIDDGGFAVTIPSILASTGGLTKTGSGTLTLTAENTYSGGTLIQEGILKLGNGSTTGFVQGDIVNNGQLVIHRSNGDTLTGVVSGTGSMELKFGTSPNYLGLMGSNTYTGATVISQGEVYLMNANGLGSTVAGTTIKTGSNLILYGLTYAAESLWVDGGGIRTTALNTPGDLDVLTGSIYISKTPTIRVNDVGDTLMLQGNISGSSGFFKTGSGIVWIQGDCGFDGPIVDSAGALWMDCESSTLGEISVLGGAEFGGSGSVAGEVRLGALSILNPGPGFGRISKLTTGSLTLSGTSIIKMDVGSLTSHDTIDVQGNLLLNGSLQLSTIPGFTAGTYTLMTYSGTLTDSGLSVTSVPVGYQCSIQAGSGKVDLVVTRQAKLFWDTDVASGYQAASGNWGTDSYWTTNGTSLGAWVDSTHAEFAGSGISTLTIVGNKYLTGMSFLSDGYTLTGDSLIFIGDSSRITAASGAEGVVNTSLAFPNGSLLEVLCTEAGYTQSGILTFTQGIWAPNAKLALTGSGEGKISGYINFSGGTSKLGQVNLASTSATSIRTELTLSGTASLELDSLNMYGSYQNVQLLDNSYMKVGRIRYNGGSSFYLSGNSTLEANKITFLNTNNRFFFDGGLLKARSSDSLMTSTGATAVMATGARIDDGGYTVIIPSILADKLGQVGTLTKTGSGTLILTGTNTYTGATTISEGTLKLGNGGATGIISSNVLNNGVLEFSQSLSPNYTFAKTISGTGDVVKSGSSQVSLTVANTYTGKTRILAGSLGVAHATGLGTATGVTEVSKGAQLAIWGGVTVAAESLYIAGTILNSSSANAWNGPLLLTDTASIQILLGALTLGGELIGAKPLQVSGIQLIMSGSGIFSDVITSNASELRLTGNYPMASLLLQPTGMLTGSGSLGGILNVSQRGILSPGNSNVVGTLGTMTVGGLTLADTSKLWIDLATPGSSDVIAVNGDLVLDGEVLLNPMTGFAPGTYNIATYTGTLTDQGLRILSAPGGYSYSVVAGGGIVQLTVSTDAPTLRWDISGTAGYQDGSGTWGVDNFWSNDGSTLGAWVDGSEALIGGYDSSYAITVSGNKSIAGIRFGSDGFTLTGDTLLLSSPARIAVVPTSSYNAVSVISNPIKATSVNPLFVSANYGYTKSGTLRLKGGLNATGQTIKLYGQGLNGTQKGYYEWMGGTYGAKTLEFGGYEPLIYATAGQNAQLTIGSTSQVSISDSIVHRYGTQNLILSDSAYVSTGIYSTAFTTTNLTVKDQAVLEVNKLSMGTNAVSYFNGGTLRARRDDASFVTAGTLLLGGNGLLLDDAGYQVVVTGILASATNQTGKLIKSGIGSVTLASNNTFIGLTRILEGDLAIGNGGTTGLLVGAIENYGNLKLNRSNVVTLLSNISGTGNLYLQNVNDKTLSGTNSFTGLSQVTGGRVLVANALAFGSETGPTLVDSGATVELMNNVSVAAETLMVKGVGLADRGALRISSTVSSAAWNGPILLQDSTLFRAAGARLSLGGVISGAFPLAIMDSLPNHTVVLNGQNTYTGNTHLLSGTLEVNGSLASTSTLLASSGTTLQGSGNVQGAVTLTGSVLSPGSGQGSVGTLTLGSLTMDTLSSLMMDVGSLASSDRIVVSGNALLQGKLVLNPLAGIQSATYTLLSTVGTLTNNGIELSSLPSGWSGSLSVVGKELRLTLSKATVMTWDAFGSTGIQAGSGSWGSDAFWTADSLSRGTWPGAGNSALLAGSPGSYAITIAGAQNVEGIHFATAGYVVGGDSILTSTNSVFKAGSGVHAYLNAPVRAEADVDWIASDGLYKAPAIFEASGGLNAPNHLLRMYGRRAGRFPATYIISGGFTRIDEAFVGGYSYAGTGSSNGPAYLGAKQANLMIKGSGTQVTADTIHFTSDSNSIVVKDSALLQVSVLTSPFATTRLEATNGAIVETYSLFSNGLTNTILFNGATLRAATSGPTSTWNYVSYATSRINVGSDGMVVDIPLSIQNKVIRSGIGNATGQVGWLRKTGLGQLNLVTSTCTGPIYIDAGTLLLNNLTSSFVQNNGVFSLNAQSASTVSSLISGIGTLNKIGNSTITLSGNNTYTGSTDIQYGTLILAHSNALGSTSGRTILNTGATLSFSGGQVVPAETLMVANNQNMQAYLDISDKTATWGGPILVNDSLTFAGNGNYHLYGGLTILGKLSGASPLKVTGGTFILFNDSNSYTGDIVVNGGRFRVKGVLPARSMTVSTGALQGVGYIQSSVDMQNATLSPGMGEASAGTLTTDALQLASTSVLRYDLGDTATSDRILVKGDVILDGSLIINEAMPGLRTARYLILEAQGRLVDNGLVLTQLPSGMQANIVVIESKLYLDVVAPNYRIWDIASTAGIQGGTGIWDASSTLWTADSLTRMTWPGASANAVFAGDSGSNLVTVQGSKQLQSIDFLSKGYTLTGDSLYIDGLSSIVAKSGITGEIDAPIRVLNDTLNLVSSGPNYTQSGSLIFRGGINDSNGRIRLFSSGGSIYYSNYSFLGDASYLARVIELGGYSGTDAAGLSINQLINLTIGGKAHMVADSLWHRHDWHNVYLQDSAHLVLGSWFEPMSTPGLKVSGASLFEVRDMRVGSGGSWVGGLKLDGGTVKPRESTSSWFVGSHTLAFGLTSNGGTIDVGTYDVIMGTGLTNAPSSVGWFRKAGAGTLVLNLDNSATGISTVAAGTLRLGNGSATGGFTGSLIDSSVVEFKRSGTASHAGTISGPGEVKLTGTAAITFTGANTYSGTTTVSSGRYVVGNASALGSALGRTTVASGAEIQLEPNMVVAQESLFVSGTGASGVGALRTTSGASEWNGPIHVQDSVTAYISGSLSLGGNIVGSGSLNLLSGTLAMSGAASYSGATQAKAATLVMHGSLSSPLGVFLKQSAGLVGSGSIVGPVVLDASANTLSPGTGLTGLGSISTLTVGSLVLGDSSILAFDLARTDSSDLVQVNGNLVLNGQLQIQAPADLPAGTYTLFTYTGTLTDNNVVLTKLPSGYGCNLTVGAGVVSLVVTASTRIAWDLSNTAGYQAGSGVWGAVANWSQDGVSRQTWPGSGNLALLGGSNGSHSVTVSGNQNVDGLEFSARGYVVSGDTLLLGSYPALTVLNGIYATISAPLSSPNANVSLISTGKGYTSNSTLTLSGGLHAGTGNIDLFGQGYGTQKGYYVWNGGAYSAQNIRLGGYPGLANTLNQNIAWTLGGNSMVTVQDSLRFYGSNQQVTLQNNATLSSPQVMIEDGSTLLVRDSAVLESKKIVSLSNSTSLTLNGGTLRALDDDSNFVSLVTGKAITLGSYGGVIDDAGHRIMIPYVIQGNGALTKAGTGRLIFTTYQPYTGTTTVQAGILQLGNYGLSGNVAGAIVNNGTVELRHTSGTAILAGVVSGTGGILQHGTTTWILQGNNTFSGDYDFQQGTLVLSHGNALGSSMGYTKVGTGATLKLATSMVVEAESLWIEGVKLSGIPALSYPDSSVTWNGPIHLDDSCVFSGDSGSLTLGGNLSGYGPLLLNAGDVVLSGHATYLGTTWLTAGSLRVDGILDSQLVVEDASLLGGGEIKGNVRLKRSNLAPGTGLNASLDTLTVGSLVLESSDTIYLDISEPGIHDQIVVDGSLQLAGVIKINAYGRPSGDYEIITYQGTLKLGSVQLIAPAQIQASLVYESGKVILRLPAQSYLTWDLANAAGYQDGDGNWSDANWTTNGTTRGIWTSGAVAVLEGSQTGDTITVTSPTTVSGIRVNHSDVLVGDTLLMTGTPAILSGFKDTIRIDNPIRTLDADLIIGSSGEGYDTATVFPSRIHTAFNGSIDAGDHDIILYGQIPSRHNANFYGTVKARNLRLGGYRGQSTPQSQNSSFSIGGTAVITDSIILVDTNNTLSIPGNVRASVVYVDYPKVSSTYQIIVIDTGRLDVGQLVLAKPNSRLNLGGTLGALQDDTNFVTGATGSKLIFQRTNSGGGVMSNATFTIDDSGHTVHINLPMSDSTSQVGTFYKKGSGTLVLGDTTSFLGGIVIENGTLQVGKGGLKGSLTGTVTNNGVLRYNRADTTLFSNEISGTGDLEVAGSGRLALSRANPFTGDVYVDSGASLSLRHVKSLGTSQGATHVRKSGHLEIYGDLVMASETLYVAGSGPYSSVYASYLGALGGYRWNPRWDGPIVLTDSTTFSSFDVSYLNISGSISGSYPLGTIGWVTRPLRLGGQNTYTGNTHVSSEMVLDGSLASQSTVYVHNNGTLSGGGVAYGHVVIENGARLDPYTILVDHSRIPAKLTLGSLAMDSAAYFEMTLGTLSDTVSVLGNALVQGQLRITEGAGFAAGSYVLVDCGGTLDYQGLSILSAPKGFAVALSVVGNKLMLDVTPLTSYTWDVADAAGIQSGNGTWGVDGNWSAQGTGARTAWAGSGSTARFAGSSGTWNVAVSGSQQVDAIQFDTSGYTISGDTLVMGTSPLLVAGSGDSGTISAFIDSKLGDLALFSADVGYTKSGLLRLEGGLDATGHRINFFGQGTASLSNVNYQWMGGTYKAKEVSLGGYPSMINFSEGQKVNLVIGSNSQVGLSGDMWAESEGEYVTLQNEASMILDRFRGFNYTYLTIKDSAVLEANSLELHPTISGLLTFNGGTLKARQSSSDFLENNVSATVTINAGGAKIDVSSYDVTINAGFIGTGGLTKLGTGALTIDADNTYTGTTTIDAGTLQLGTGDTTGSVVGAIVNNGILSINRRNLWLFNQIISGNGSLIQQGIGYLALGGKNTFSGRFDILAGGQVNARSDSALGTTVGPTSVASGATLKLVNNTTFAPESLYLAGSGKSGLGALQLGEGNTHWTGPIILTDSALFYFYVYNKYHRISGVISGAYPLVINGLGVGNYSLALEAANTYTGNTHLQAGSLLVNGSTSPTSTIFVSGMGVLGGSGTVSGPVMVSSGGTLAPGDTGSTVGTLTLGSLQMDSESMLNFTLGSVAGSDKIVVNGNVVLAGALAVDSIAGFDAGTYTLMTWTGSATNNGISLGAMPTGFSYSLQVGADKLTLVVNKRTTQTWDLATLAGFQSGSGHWNMAGASWSIDGTTLGTWNDISQVATFAGTRGKWSVVLDSKQQAAGLDFVSSGYTLSGDSLVLLDQPSVVARSGVSTTIASPIRIANGPLQLYASNTDYTAQSSLQFSGGIDASSTSILFYGKNLGAPTAAYNLSGGTVRAKQLALGGYSATAMPTKAAGLSLVLGGTVQVNADTISIGGESQILTIQDTALVEAGLLSGGVTTSQVWIQDNAVLSLGSLRWSRSASALQLNGGTLRALRSGTDFITASAGDLLTVTSLGGTLDDAGFDVTLRSGMGGSGTLIKQGSGSVTLDSSWSHTGALALAAGRLILNGATLNSASLAISNGATLEGHGSVLGSVTMAAGSEIVLDSVGNGPFQLGSLSMNSTSTITIPVYGSGLEAQVLIGENLILDGTLQFSIGSGFGQFTDTLMQVTGTIDNRGLLCGAVPSGYTCQVQVMGKAVVVSVLGRQFHWDVAGTAGYQTGSGIWGVNPYWSDNGTSLNVWPVASGTATFPGPDGSYNIQLSGTQNADSIFFTANGYTLSGDTLQLSSAAIIDVSALDTTTVSASLVKGFGTVKTGAGHLRLTGNAQFTGTMQVQAGSLSVDGSVTGSDSIFISNGATLSGAGTISAPVSLASGAQLLPSSMMTLGGLRMNAGSTIRLQVGSIANTTRITSTGAIGLAGTLFIDSVAGFGQALTLLMTSTQTISGLPTLQGIPTGWTSSLILRNDSLWLKLNQPQPPTGIAFSDTVVNENTANPYALAVLSAMDPNSSDSFIYSLVAGSGSTNNNLFHISNDTLWLDSSVDFETISNLSVRIKVTDSDLLAFEKTQTISVLNLNDNAPVITSNGGGATATVNISENTTAVTTVTATDADGTSPTFAFNGGADEAIFAINATTGALTFITAPDFDAPADANADNIYTVIVRASDGILNSDQTFTITVTDLNESPVISRLEAFPASILMTLGDTADLEARFFDTFGTQVDTIPSDLRFTMETSHIGKLIRNTLVTSDTGRTQIIVTALGLRDTISVIVKPDSIIVVHDTIQVPIGMGVVLIIPPSTKPWNIQSVAVANAGQDGIQGALSIQIGSSNGALPATLMATIPTDTLAKLAGSAQVYLLMQNGSLQRLPSTSSILGLSFNTASQGTYLVGYDSVPPTVTLEGENQLLHHGGNLQLGYLLEDNISNPTLLLHYRLPGDTTTHTMPARISSDGSLVVDSTLLALGATLWIEGSDGVHQSKSTPIDVTAILPPQDLPGALPDAHYGMFAVPYQNGEATVLDMLSAKLGKYNPSKWRAYLTHDETYSEISDFDSLRSKPGQAYWIRIQGINPSFRTDSLSTYPLSKSTPIILNPGWSAISSPFDFDVSWKDIQTASGIPSAALKGPYAYEGTTGAWSRPDTTNRIRAWQGYLVKNTTSQPVTLQVQNLSYDATRSLARSSVQNTLWTLTPSQGSAEGASAFAGIHAQASMGPDSLDQPFPPILERRLAASFRTGDGTSLLHDMRPSATLKEWSLSVQNLQPNTPLTLAFAGQVTTPDNRKPWLLERKGQALHSLKNGSVRIAVGSESKREFALVFLTDDEALQMNSLVRNTLKPIANYRQQTASWTLPASIQNAWVRVSITDVRGRIVAQLANERQDAGSYSALIPPGLNLRNPAYRLVLQVNGKSYVGTGE
jgi:autotransporter-associated beta strand protein